jgi:hypothetical protein
LRQGFFPPQDDAACRHSHRKNLALAVEIRFAGQQKQMADAELSMTLANLIFPAPALVYALGLFTPFAIVAALATEWFVFETREGGKQGLAMFLMIFHLNFWSTFIGLFVVTRFSSGIETATNSPSVSEQLSRSPEDGALALLGLAIAYILSIAIEYAALRIFYNDVRWNSPFKTVLIANSISYPVYIGLALVFR